MSSLDQLIPPEIKDDPLYHALYFLAKQPGVRTILEIGASSGQGSTEALSRGARENKEKPALYSIEVARTRFAALAARYADFGQLRPFNVSSVSVNEFPTQAQVAEFHRARHSTLSAYPLEIVLGWLRQDIAYIVDNHIPQDGIATIKAVASVNVFDLVLIDGSEFTGQVELAKVYGSGLIALDDINGYKNMDNHQRLLADPAYELCMMDRFCRHGFSVFARRDWLSAQ